MIYTHMHVCFRHRYLLTPFDNMMNQNILQNNRGYCKTTGLKNIVKNDVNTKEKHGKDSRKLTRKYLNGLHKSK